MVHSPPIGVNVGMTGTGECSGIDAHPSVTLVPEEEQIPRLGPPFPFCFSDVCPVVIAHYIPFVERHKCDHTCKLKETIGHDRALRNVHLQFV